MHQTFSGSSRRPRNVNLSGQNLNPFAATAWTPASASGTQKTVANAQQERLQRQQERERLNASKRIQRTWRGHKVRKDLADERRSVWDEREARSGEQLDLLEDTRVLVSFFKSSRRDDLERLHSLSKKISNEGYRTFFARQGVQHLLSRLSSIALAALQSALPDFSPIILQLLVAVIDRRPDLFPQISQSYYALLSRLVIANPRNLERHLMVTSLETPLLERIDLDNNYEIVLDAYAAFAQKFLATPDLAMLLGPLEDLAAAIDISILSSALVYVHSSSGLERMNSERKLWLLAHFISLNRLQGRSTQDPEFLRALSLQLSSSSSDIVGRIDGQDLEVLQEAVEGEEKLPPLPSFVKAELLTLVNQQSITGLLAKFNIDYAKASAAGEEDASLLASYALTLLRIFPRRGDEIRMWLYLGSMATSKGSEVPALKFFWQATSLTSTFSAITADSKAALSILRPSNQDRIMSDSSSSTAREREWRTVLLFLELYTFVLRFTDDEEFLGTGTANMNPASYPVSRIRESALPLEDVKRLTIFLKNLAFTTYFNASELSEGGHAVVEGGLGSHFGSTTTSRFQTQEIEKPASRPPSRPFAGVAGMTFDYVRTIVTGVMRMLYERDSRRRFLPKDHWLMTSRFDMEGFITHVVMEEERQHEVREEGEEDDVDDPELADSREELALVGMGRSRRNVQIEAMRRQQQKAMRTKLLASVGPRLEVLQNMPFAIPFETRVKIFREFVYMDQTRRRGGNVDPDIWRMSIMQQQQLSPRHSRASANELLGRHHAKIRRDQIFDDAYEQFYELGNGLKEPIQITFVDQFDTVEAGIDGGGVTKEFLTSVTNEAFRAENGPNLFVTNDQNLLFPNPVAVDERRELLRQAGIKESTAEWRENIKELLRRYEFLGRVVGKCLYEGILVDIGFAGFFLLKWAASGNAESGYRANINDLRDLDESLYQGLLKLKNYPGNVEDFSLDFTITDTVSLPGSPTQTISRDLMPNGSNISVTNENRPLYVSYVARHRLQVQPYQQTHAFLKGLSDIINPSWLSMFNQSELQTLIGGDSSEINVDDLRRNTLYGGVYVIGDDNQEHDTVKLFWKVMKELDDTERRKVLKYVTSTPRAPLLGFSQLNPRFSIRDGGGDEERLPSTSTCVNLLKLPRYSSERTLRDKLLYAVNSGAGFDLS